MTLGFFKDNIRRSIDLLKKYSLFKKKNEGTGTKIIQNYNKYEFRANYQKIYEDIIKNENYNILLSDESVIKFEYENIGNYHQPKLRYIFFQNPFDSIYERFSQIDNDVEENIRDDFLDDFIKITEEINTNMNFVTMRYDLDEKQYLENCHPTSHLHIGLSKNIRIPSKIVITPLAFTILVIKFTYYDEWKRLIYTDSSNSVIKLLLNAKKDCPMLPSLLFSLNDLQEMNLS